MAECTAEERAVLDALSRIERLQFVGMGAIAHLVFHTTNEKLAFEIALCDWRSSLGAESSHG